MNTLIVYYSMSGNTVYAAAIKKLVRTPVATVGAHGDPELMEDLVASGKVDVVEIARGLMADPDLVNKVRTGVLAFSGSGPLRGMP